MDNFDLKKFLVENKATYNSRLVESDEFEIEFDADSELEKLDSKIKKGEYIPTTSIIRRGDKITSADFDFNAIRKDSKYDPVVKKIEGAEVRNIDPIKKEIKLRLEDGWTELIYPYAFLRNIIIPGHKFEKIDDK